MGIFDGHGLNGHRCSNFVMCAMADYIKHSPQFTVQNLESFKKEQMEKAMRKCFRYAQDKLKEQYRAYLIRKKRQEYE